MGHVHDGRPEPLMQLLDFDPHLGAQLGVEVGQRLVHQEDGGPADHGAAERHALALAARQLAGLAAEQGFDLQRPRHAQDIGGDVRTDPRRAGEKTADQRQALPAVQPAHAQGQRDVSLDRVVRIKRVALEHHGHVARLGPQCVDSPPGDRDRARVFRLEAGDDPEKCRLATARGAQQRHEFAVVYGKRHIAQDLRAAKGLGEAIDREVGHDWALGSAFGGQQNLSRQILLP